MKHLPINTKRIWSGNKNIVPLFSCLNTETSEQIIICDVY